MSQSKYHASIAQIANEVHEFIVHEFKSICHTTLLEETSPHIKIELLLIWEAAQNVVENELLESKGHVVSDENDLRAQRILIVHTIEYAISFR